MLQQMHLGIDFLSQHAPAHSFSVGCAPIHILVCVCVCVSVRRERGEKRHAIKNTYLHQLRLLFLSAQ
jgi:hypothetical protein